MGLPRRDLARRAAPRMLAALASSTEHLKSCAYDLRRVRSRPYQRNRHAIAGPELRCSAAAFFPPSFVELQRLLWSSEAIVLSIFFSLSFRLVGILFFSICWTGKTVAETVAGTALIFRHLLLLLQDLDGLKRLANSASRIGFR